MPTQTKTSDDLGNEVLKTIGSLESATKDLKAQNGKSCAPDQDEVVGILTQIGRVILKLFQ